MPLDPLERLSVPLQMRMLNRSGRMPEPPSAAECRACDIRNAAALSETIAWMRSHTNGGE
jgi:hypothetical protein